MDMLGEYGVGRGQFVGHDFDPIGPAPANVIQIVDIEQMLVTQLEQGLLQPPDGNLVYFVFLPPQVTVSDGKGYQGVHTWVPNTEFGPIIFAVITQPYGVATLDVQTGISSHELAEVATDPTGQGWFAGVPNGGEIGDLCNDQFGSFKGYVVQKEWSNQYQTGILPMPANLNQVANLFTHSDEYFRNQVENYYGQLLGRNASAVEINTWVNLMEQGVTDEQVMAGFVSSPEYCQRAGGTDQAWVQQLYWDLLGWSPDVSGEDAWLLDLAAGQSQRAVAYGFTTSNERENLLIIGYYRRCLGRAPSSSEAGYWVSSLTAGLTQEAVLAGIAASAESFFIDSASALDTWVTSVYDAVLRRAPNDNEVQFWLAFLMEDEWARLS
jgi:hypothetical protein